METNPTKGNEAHADFSDHCGIDDEFENIERKSRASILQTEHDRCDRESRHAQIEEDVCSRVDEPVGDAARNLLSCEGIEGFGRSTSAHERKIGVSVRFWEGRRKNGT